MKWTQDGSTLQFGHVSNRTDHLNQRSQGHRPGQKLRDVRYVHHVSTQNRVHFILVTEIKKSKCCYRFRN
jgi:hypothetical protein